MDYYFRKVNDNDREAVINIFNYFVENGFAAYPEKKVGFDFFERLKNMCRGYPFYVIETENRDVIGFGLLRSYKHAEVFKRVAKLTYFILPEHTRKGLGHKLLGILSEEAKNMGINTLLASVSSLNEISLNFHRKNGFLECGRFKRMGEKYGKDFDVIYMQKFI